MSVLFFVDNPAQLLYYTIFFIGKWLSLVEHSVRDAGVAGSNPVFPTISQIKGRFCFRTGFFIFTRRQFPEPEGLSVRIFSQNTRTQ